MTDRAPDNLERHERKVLTMAKFSFGKPSADQRAAYAQIQRCRPTQIVRGIALSEYLGAELHWLSGRSSPHLEPHGECPGCLENRSRRWEGYVWLWEPQTSAIRIAAFTPGVVSNFDGYVNSHGTLRAASVTLSKPGGKPTSRVHAQITRSTYGLDQLPHPPDTLNAALMHIWGLDQVEGLEVAPTLKPACHKVTQPNNPGSIDELAEAQEFHRRRVFHMNGDTNGEEGRAAS